MKHLADIYEGILDPGFDVNTKDINPLLRLINSMDGREGMCKFDPKPFDELWKLKDSRFAAEEMGGRLDNKAYEYFYKPQVRKYWKDEIIMLFYGSSIALISPRGYLTFNRETGWGSAHKGPADNFADSITKKCSFESIWVFSLKFGDRTGFLNTKYKHLLWK